MNFAVDREDGLNGEFNGSKIHTQKEYNFHAREYDEKSHFKGIHEVIIDEKARGNGEWERSW